MMNDLMKRLLRIAKENPQGFTVEIPTCRPIKKGWVVAMKETQNCFGMEGLKKVLAIANETTKIVGGWKDGQFYWDAVMTFEDENEATKAGIENEQIAIYNIEQNRVKRLL